MPEPVGDQLPCVPASETQCAFKPLGCQFPGSADAKEMQMHYEDAIGSHVQIGAKQILDLKKSGDKLNARVNILEAENEKLKNQVRNLETRLQRLEANNPASNV